MITRPKNRFLKIFRLIISFIVLLWPWSHVCISLLLLFIIVVVLLLLVVLLLMHGSHVVLPTTSTIHRIVIASSSTLMSGIIPAVVAGSRRRRGPPITAAPARMMRGAAAATHVGVMADAAAWMVQRLLAKVGWGWLGSCGEGGGTTLHHRLTLFRQFWYHSDEGAVLVAQALIVRFQLVQSLKNNKIMIKLKRGLGKNHVLHLCKFSM